MTTNNMPLGSHAVLLPSPLGTNVPLFKTADRVSGGASGTPTPYLKLAGRTFFRPDAVGQYTVVGHDHHDRHHQWDDHRSDRNEHQHHHHGVHLSWRELLLRCLP